MRQIPLFRIGLFFIAGLLIQQVNSFDLKWVILGFGNSLLISCYCFIKAKSNIRFISLFGIASSIFFVFTGLFLASMNKMGISTNYYGHFLQEKTSITGKIVHQKEGDRYNQLIIKVSELSHDGVATSSLNGQLQVFTPIDTLKIGDVIEFTTTCHKIEKNQNAFTFDYQSFMNNKGIEFTCFPKLINKLKSEATALDTWREEYLLAIQDLNVNDNSHAILQAMLAGDKSDLGNLTEVFRRTGASHVLAISGLHVGIIALIVNFLCSFLPKKLNALKAMILCTSVWIFCLLSGCFPSTIRACIMVSAYSVSILINRRSFGLNICFFAAIIMLIINPNQLFEIGFQFSFLALFGIMIFFERFSKIFIFRGIKQKIWQMSVMSFTAQIFILPLSLYYFHTFPVYFLPASIVAVPMTFLIVCGGIFSLVLEFFGFGFQFVLQAINWMIDSFVFILEFISNLPGACIVDLWPHWAELLLYFLMVWLVSQKEFLANLKMRFLSMAVMLLLLSFNSWKKYDLVQDRVIVYAHKNEIVIDLLSQGTIRRYHEESAKLVKREYETAATESYFQAQVIDTNEIPNSKNQVINWKGKSILVLNNFDHINHLNYNYILLNNVPLDISLDTNAEVIDFRYTSDNDFNPYLRKHQIIEKI